MGRFLYSIVFILGCTILGHSQVIQVPVLLDWDSPIPARGFSEGTSTAYSISFDGAVNHDQWGSLPLYFTQLPANSLDYGATINILDPVFTPLEFADSTIHDRELIPHEWQTFHEMVITRKQPYVNFYLLPVRTDPATQRMEVLQSCTLVIQLEEGATRYMAGRSTVEHTTNSVLSSGDWYKLAIEESGVYRIGYQDLLGYGIDPKSIDPKNIRIFGNGGRMLNESTSLPRLDDLIENSIKVIGQEDGRFDEQDYILFYGQGPVTWSYNPFYMQYEHELNLYTDKTRYFLNIGQVPGKRIPADQAVPGAADIVLSTTDDFAYHERDSLNLIKSGKEWYGEVFASQSNYDYVFHFPNVVRDSTAYFKANFVARSTESSQFTISYNGEYLGEQQIGSVQVGSAIYARTMTTRIFDFLPNDDIFRFNIDYSRPNNTSTGWLNYIQVNVKSHLVFDGGQRAFRSISSVGQGKIAQFNIASNVEGIRVWDITDPLHSREIETLAVTDGRAIRVAADSLREFIAFDNTGLLTPVFEKRVENQNLHGLHPSNLVIVAHPPLMPEAERLADFHRQQTGLTVNVVTPEQIYNEFSSGSQDIAAIRDFLKMLYDRNDEMNELRYLLLFGDASYDYKDRIPEDNNLVPTFQSKESLKTASSFVTDDFFGCLDYGEGSNASGTVDLGIGRFPVRDLEEARVIVDKVIHYATGSREVLRPWRNTICLVADDEDNNIHLDQAEELALIIDTSAAAFNVDKIYLDAYLQQSSPVGARYPDVSVAINKSVDQGALIINYTGHGGETGWAHEKVLDMPMILAWDNYDRLAAFVTATCEFSRFDDPSLVSAGEWVILNPKGGGIGLFTTTRLAYSTSNAALNKRFYQAAFHRDPMTGEYPRMGDLMRLAKTPSSQNIKNFVLLGDPALMLAYPHFNVSTLEINNVYSGKATDTLSALSHVTITGQVEDLYGNRLEDFQGVVYPEIFDKPVVYQTRANDDASKVTDFQIQNKVLYKGEATVSDGLFSFSFIVPKDISYQFGPGKISYYAVDTLTYRDAHGYSHVQVGGADDLSASDEQGPAIELFLNDTTFISGDVTVASPVLLARLFDESGINTVGNGIGHDITAVLDGHTQNPFILNDHYTPDPDTYQSGWLRYPLGRLQPGEHTLSLKAWDIYNNSSEATITFVIDTVSPLLLKEVYNYPNPFREGTNFVFHHNKPGSDFEVVVDIFSLDGKYVESLNYHFTSENLESVPMYWNGLDTEGNELRSGFYIYRMWVNAGQGKTAYVSQKMIIIR